MWLKEALTFSRSERKGIAFLLLLVISVWWIPCRYGRQAAQVSNDVQIDSILTSQENQGTAHPVEYIPGKSTGFSSARRKQGISTERARFSFDPNTATSEDWQRLGVPDRNVRTILRFLDKGGRFRSPQDLGKIYGLSPQLLTDLLPLVKISRGPSAVSWSNEPIRRSEPNQNWKKPPANIEINGADSLAWESLPGIGPNLAGRIVRYREKLGGFYQISQVGETFGLPDSTFRSIEHRLRHDSGYTPDPLYVNKATWEQLSAHPYVSYRQAKAIVAYRDQHGPFRNRIDLARITSMTPELLDRIERYLNYD